MTRVDSGLNGPSSPARTDEPAAGPGELFSVLLRARLGSGAQTRLGRYVLLRILGEGGMGVVFSAYDEELDRRVAIKVLSVPATGGTTGRARIRREAQALAKLSHPNIVQIYEVGEEAGQIYLVMELIDGDNLRVWQQAASRSWREILGRWTEAGRGLAAAHKAGLIHRDLKPDNAILGRDGRVRVVDFGLARSGDLAEVTPSADEAHREGTTLTVAGTMLGTPAYMAPEQHLRLQVDHRADIFAFCVALHEGLYGERPFVGQGTMLAVAVASGHVREPPRGSKVPQWLRRVVRRGLRADLAERWQDMDTLLAALADDPVVRWRRFAGISALVVGAAAVGNLVGVDGSEEPPRAARPARRSPRCGTTIGRGRSARPSRPPACRTPPPPGPMRAPRSTRRPNSGRPRASPPARTRMSTSGSPRRCSQVVSRACTSVSASSRRCSPRCRLAVPRPSTT